MSCHFCGEEFEESETPQTLSYKGTTYLFHEACDNDENIVTDYRGVSAPRGEVDICVCYDGGNSRNCQGREIAFENDNDTFLCEICNESFYGDGEDVSDGSYDVRVCCYCYENGTYYDEGSGRTYLNRECAPEHEQHNAYPEFVGTPTDRYMAKPLVGIEFEHAPIRGGSIPFYSLFENGRYAIHSDGSIACMSGYESNEIVSNPASGNELERMIDDFYMPFSERLYTPGPEHPTCGFHMHVASRFLNKFKMGSRSSEASLEVRDNAICMLTMINRICREFISSSRRRNHFCCSEPAMRSKDMSFKGAEEMSYIFNTRSYPSIAIRSIATVEFRLWPSSNSMLYTKARAELSQKIIAYWDRCLLDDDDHFQFNKAAAERLANIGDLVGPSTRLQVVDRLRDLLELSDPTVTSLKHMQQRFSPISCKTSKFKFTDRQISALTDEPSELGIDCFDFRQATIHTSGDTTVEASVDGSNQELFISFSGGIKCYPGTRASEQLEVVSQYAKGEI